MADPFKTALEVRGAASALARELKISRAAVAKWERVPAERVVDVERITGIPREVLRPDIFRTGDA